MEYCNGMMYAVKQGDTLYSISLKYGIPLVLLLRANPYVDVYNLQVGETICIPMKNKECNTCCRKNTEEKWEVERNDNDRDGGRGDRDNRDGRNDRDDWNDRDGKRDDWNDRDGNRGGRNDRDDDDRDDWNDRDGNRGGRNDRDDNDRDDWNERGGRRGNWNDRMQLVSEPENTLESEEAVDASWQRYVSKPGDTLETVLEEKCSQSLEEFLEHNSMDRIYLLPGIVYRCKEDSGKKRS